MTRLPWWSPLWSSLRAATALAIIAAIIAQAQVTIGGAAAAGKNVATTTVNFFSFFTILSNLAAAVVLIWAVTWFLMRRSDAATAGVRLVEPRALAVSLAAVTTYMVITGIVYNTLLRGIPLPQGSTVPWSNEVLHVGGPVFLLVDLFVGPARRALPWRAIWEVLVFPIVWVAYTLIRGPLATDPGGRPPWWYPYPFLNPHEEAGGYLGVEAYVVVIAMAIAAVATGVVWVGRRRGARALTRAVAVG